MDHLLSKEYPGFERPLLFETHGEVNPSSVRSDPAREPGWPYDGEQRLTWSHPFLLESMVECMSVDTGGGISRPSWRRSDLVSGRQTGMISDDAVTGTGLALGSPETSGVLGA